MQSTNVSRNHTDSDLYFNSSRHQDHAISLQTVELLESSFEDELTEVETSVEEITVQHPQPVVARLLADMEEELLANNLDQLERYGTEYTIEYLAQDTSNISRRTQLTDQAGYSLSPQKLPEFNRRYSFRFDSS